MFKLRFMTAIVLISVVVSVVSLTSSPYYLLGLVWLLIFIAGVEFCAVRWHAIEVQEKITQRPTPQTRIEHIFIGFIYAATLPICYLTDTFYPKSIYTALEGTFIWTGLCSILSCLIFYKREPNLELAVDKFINIMGGFSYVVFPSILAYRLSILEVANAPRGIGFYYLLAIVFSGDTGAYLAGMFFGKHPLMPKVSPKKTWEGAFGGLLCSSAASLLLVVIFNLPLHWITAIFAGIFGGAAAQMGDLVESAIKRSAACKDSGSIFPGHGGVLDRIDGVLLGAPIIYMFFI